MKNDALRRYETLLSDAPLSERLDGTVPGLEHYRGFSELLGAMRALAERGISLDVAGESLEGAPIVRLAVGPVGARSSLVIAGLHAMEWIGVESCLALASALLEKPLDRRVVIFPLLNPDGFRRAERDLLVGRRRFVRTNARGVDLNRNWPTHWQKRLFLPTFLPFLGQSGEGPASEPEIAAVLRTLEGMVPGCDRAVSFHSFGKMLLLPYGGRWGAPARIEILTRHAEAVRTRLASGYGVRRAGRWGPGTFAYGMELDHFDALGIDSLLVECSAGGLSPLRPGSWLHPMRWFNPPKLEEEREAIARAVLPFVLGR